MSEIHGETLPLAMVAMNEHVRSLVRNHPNRSDLSLDAGVKYHALTYFALNPGSTLRMDDLEKLMRHFGFEIKMVVQPVTPPTLPAGANQQVAPATAAA
ncbi:MAG: hypothetical protein ABIF45_11670 [Pseudomonadota bacterium]